MEDSLRKTFSKNVNKIFKQSGFGPYKYLLLAVLAGVVFVFVDGVSSYIGGSYTFLLSLLLVLISFFILFGVCTPLLYGVTLTVSDRCRFSKTSFDIKSVFRNYYHTNNNPYHILNCYLLGLIGGMVGTMIVSSILAIVIKNTNPHFFEDFANYYQSVLNGANANQAYDMYLSQWSSALNSYSAIASGGELLGFSLVFFYRMRLNESTFYCCSSLFADNRIDVPSTPFVRTIKRGMFPIVKKEHLKLSFQVNWYGYLIPVLVYAGSLTGMLFITNFPVNFAPSIALLLALFVYMPFYYRERIFDSLFYTAYSDKIFNNLSPLLSGLVSQTRDAMDEAFSKADDQDQDVSFTETDNSDVNDDEDVKKGTIDTEDGTIDFTKDDKKDDDK